MTAPHAASPETSHHLALEEQRWLTALRAHRKSHREKAARRDDHLIEVTPPPATRGQRLADAVARTMGSWTFIALQSMAIVVWITSNVLSGSHAWDAYPFILLNLLLSFQAAYTAPAIMMSQNRQSEIDRRRAENDYEINVKAELEIELLHEKIDVLKEQELLNLTQAVRDLSTQLAQLSSRLHPESGTPTP
jgi:uncharacterized membrane protein